MNAIGYAASVSDARNEIDREYRDGNISEDERNWRLNHIMGF